jgi:hypothetical protein
MLFETTPAAIKLKDGRVLYHPLCTRVDSLISWLNDSTPVRFETFDEYGHMDDDGYFVADGKFRVGPVSEN